MIGVHDNMMLQGGANPLKRSIDFSIEEPMVCTERNECFRFLLQPGSVEQCRPHLRGRGRGLGWEWAHFHDYTVVSIFNDLSKKARTETLLQQPFGFRRCFAEEHAFPVLRIDPFCIIQD